MSQQPTANSQQRSVIARFKRACVNFRKGVGGFGVIEAAFTLPIFIGITFAVIDYGMMMSNRSSAAGNISSLTRTIQDNPQISPAQLNALVISAGGGSVNFTATGNCFCAQSFTTQAAAQTFVDQAGCGTGCDSGTRSTGTGTPRYIGVRGQVTYNFITPVNKIFVGEPTKVLKFGQVVPVGVTVCPARGCALPQPSPVARGSSSPQVGRVRRPFLFVINLVKLCNLMGLIGVVLVFCLTLKFMKRNSESVTAMITSIK
jgi:Flp pilus assembly protein TadG